MSSPSEAENAPRWQEQPGFFETYTLKVHEPKQGVALCVRQTLVSPVEGEPYGVVWGFGSDSGRPNDHLVLREVFAGEQIKLLSDPFSFMFKGVERPPRMNDHEAHGRLEDHDRRLGWMIHWTASDDEEPFRHYPRKGFYDGGFPSAKVLAPHPNLRVNGEILFNKRRILLENSPAIQLHQWGTKAPLASAWAHCNSFAEDPTALFEAIAETHPKVALFEPNLSVFRFRVEGEDHVANGLLKMFTTKSQYDLTGWYFDVVAGDRRFEGTIEIPYTHLVGVAEQDPDGAVLYQYQTIIGGMSLSVYVKERGKWVLERELTSENGCAMQVMQREPDAEAPLMIDELVQELA